MVPLYSVHIAENGLKEIFLLGLISPCCRKFYPPAFLLSNMQPWQGWLAVNISCSRDLKSTHYYLAMPQTECAFYKNLLDPMKLQANYLLAMLICKIDEWTNKFQCAVFNQVLSVLESKLWHLQLRIKRGSADFSVMATWYKLWMFYKKNTLILHLISLVSQKQKLLKWTKQWKTNKQRQLSVPIVSGMLVNTSSADQFCMDEV